VHKKAHAITVHCDLSQDHGNIFASRTVLFIRVGNKKAKYFTVIQREPD